MPESFALVRLRLLFAYNGGCFRGVAPQPNTHTVGDAIRDALKRVLRQPELPFLVVAGRTDAGVHAWGQVAHVDVRVREDFGRVELDRLIRSLRSMLGPDIVVRTVDIVEPAFDARRSADWRRYRYTILNRSEPSPFLAATTWHIPDPLDVASMRLACDPLLGDHDFTSFCRAATDRPHASLVRYIHSATWSTVHAEEVALLRFEIVANAFCRQMVRSIVGFMAEVGTGKRHAGELTGVLGAKSRTGGSPIAPAHGLCLWEVGYPADDGVRDGAASTALRDLALTTS